jgi:flagellar protein FliS
MPGSSRINGTEARIDQTPTEQQEIAEHVMQTTTAYLARELSAASPAKKVAMLIDRAIQALNEAMRAIERGDIQARWTANNQAGTIIETLWRTRRTLDLEQGGEIAANLDRLYSFMLQHLTQVDLRNDPQPAADVIRLLEPLRRSWHELASKEAKAAAQPTAASRDTADGAGSSLAVSA